MMAQPIAIANPAAAFALATREAKLLSTQRICPGCNRTTDVKVINPETKLCFSCHKI
jgi:transposase-like protein